MVGAAAAIIIGLNFSPESFAFERTGGTFGANR
jgi:hypothetical protein